MKCCCEPCHQGGQFPWEGCSAWRVFRGTVVSCGIVKAVPLYKQVSLMELWLRHGPMASCQGCGRGAVQQALQLAEWGEHSP